MIDITDADRAAVDRLIDMARAANEEGMPLQDRHDMWRQAFAAHRIAAVRAERERIISRVKEFGRTSDAIWAIENEGITTNSEATG